jgi:hypothetical protein
VSQIVLTFCFLDLQDEGQDATFSAVIYSEIADQSKTLDLVGKGTNEKACHLNKEIDTNAFAKVSAKSLTKNKIVQKVGRPPSLAGGRIR